MTSTTFARRLRAGSALSTAALALGLAAAPAFAQIAPASSAEQGEEIVVTGSILRQTTAATVSPVTTIKVEELDKRGISTIQDAIQSLASSNGPALTNSFSANGAFAAGASAVSLRGLSTNSTLVLFDGLRAAYYPIADDGSRNFVDLNTIPDDIVENVEVLRDGASASYGADAIAGVVNIKTKRQFKGLSLKGEGGISQRADGGQYRLSLTAGVGDLDEKGYNAYISTFYYKQNALMNKDRPFPYNTDNTSALPYGGNNVINAVGADGTISAGLLTSGNFMVRPYAATDTAQTSPLGRYQSLGLSTCPGVVAAVTNPGAVNPTSVCQVDSTNLYGTINPNIERFGASAKFTAMVTDSIEAYAEFNFIQSKVNYTGFPSTVYGTAPASIFFPRFRTSGLGGADVNFANGSNFLTLPVYVCAARVNCTAANGTLNPNNPFASQGQVARLIGRDLNHVTYNETRSRAYRGAFGVHGPITDTINFDVGATAMHMDLRRRQDGYVYIQHLLDVVADGSYNFINPAANSQATLDYLYPSNITNASSDQVQGQAVLSAKLLDLPGGPLQLAVGGSVRYEAVNAPSANSDINGPTQRYFTLNAFGTKGSRKIYSAFFEADAPVIDMVTLNISGRYDKYSTGPDNFSPKFGVKFKPIREVLLRGTYSKGFRIPSFGEANALPTTGFVNNTAGLFNNAYLAQYSTATSVCSVATFATGCPTYIRSSSYGITTLASPNLKPEKSRSFTGGILLEPLPGKVTLTVDYYNIKKTNAVISLPAGPALAAYYTGQPIPAGYTVIPDAVDVNNPTAKPRVGFVQSARVNADTIKTSGLDFGANINLNVLPNLKWRSSFDATYIIKFEQITPDGQKLRFDGTLGNFDLTAGNGTQKWHGSWQNSLEYGKVTLTGTANYYGGYNLSAMDQGDDYKDCGQSPDGVYCHVKRYITFDLNASIKVTDKLTVYGTVLNLFDDFPPIDPVTYGAHYYNAVQGGNGILGRYFKMGVKVSL